MEVLSDVALALERHRKTTEKVIEYGTAGFRARAEYLDHIVFRMGILAGLRSKLKNATVGVMITASHNPEEDNGVKLIDPFGEMLEASWETFATDLANVSDAELPCAIEKIVECTKLDMQNSAFVISARDTRPSSDSLSRAVQDGVIALGATFTDFGLLTTPQLHYIVRCINTNGQYGVPSTVGYYNKLSTAFMQLYNSAFAAGNRLLYKPLLYVDGSNGVGALKLAELLKCIETSQLTVQIFNDGTRGKLNHLCGADYVKVQQKAPEGLPLTVGMRCASFDGDADRIVYFYVDYDGEFRLLDGDKIATLIAGYIGDLVRAVSEPFRLGVVQTAYANGSSTSYVTDVVGLPVDCVPTGVKHLHHAAQQFDIGIYFEANGHGTVLFNPRVSESLHDIVHNDQYAVSQKQAAEQLLLLIDVINQTVGDALSDLLLVELILATRDWDIQTWNSQYTDLPNRQLKIAVKDRKVIQTTDAERKLLSPQGLQQRIDQLVNNCSHGRSFVRPSGTEDVVRVYAEADTQVNADMLAYQVSLLVFDAADGVGDRPKLPSVKT
jgi:phosphoacetylglucosamine mutase